MDQIRQGDVMLIPTDEIKGSALGKQKKVVLALGEVTGHHHRFEDGNVKMFRHDDGGTTGAWLLVDKPAELIHEEHGKITVQPGKYRQSYQVEYTPQAIQRVAD